MKPLKKEYYSSSLLKGLDLIRLLYISDKPMAMREIVAMFRQPRTSTLRILTTLEIYGLVERVGSIYHLRKEVFESKEKTRNLAYTTFLNKIHQETRELVSVGRLHGHYIRLIDYRESPQGVTVRPEVEKQHPLEKTAMGKLILTQRPDLLAKTRDQRILTEINEASKTGYAYNHQESQKDYVALATWLERPSSTSHMISVTWPVYRFSKEEEVRVLKIFRAILPCFVSSSPIFDPSLNLKKENK